MVGPAFLLFLAARPGGETEGPHVRPLASVAAALSAEMGRPIETERALRNVPVLVDEPGRSPLQRLDDLAFALRASLVRDGKALRIERSPADRRAVEAAHRSLVRQKAEAALATFDRVLRRSSLLGDEAAQRTAAQQAIDRVLREFEAARAAGQDYAPPGNMVDGGLLGAVGRLTLEIVRRVGPERLADVPLNGIRFYSDHPNGAESPLPKCEDLLARYARSRSMAAGSPGSVEPPAKTILRVNESGATLRLYDARGHETGEYWLDYQNRVMVAGPGYPLPGGPGARWLPLKPRSVEMAAFLSPDDEAMVAAMQRGNATLGMPVQPPLPPVPEPYLRPERDDPLDFAVREGVLAMGREPGTQGTVAVLSDWTLGLANACVRDGRLDVAAFERGLYKNDPPSRLHFERVAHAGVTVLRPADPLVSESALVDRVALGKGIRGIRADGRIGLRNWPALHFALYPGRDSDVEHRYVAALFQSGMGCPVDLLVATPPMLALLGAVQSTGAAVAGTDFPPIRAILREGLAQGWFAFRSDAPRSDLAMAPSSLLASDVLSDAKVSLRSSETTVIDTDGGLPSGFVGNEVGHLVYFALYPSPVLPRSEALTRRAFRGVYADRHYRVGVRSNLDVGIRLGGGLASDFRLQDSLLQGPDVRFDQLPLAFRNDMYQHARSELEKEGTPVPRFLYGDGG